MIKIESCATKGFMEVYEKCSVELKKVGLVL